MQFAKDSFFLALRGRLAGLNPGRVVTVNGATVPAILVAENLPPTSKEREGNTFYLNWGVAGVVDGESAKGLLMSMECSVSYHTSGSVASMVDRGRVLGELDSELLAICQPTYATKRDYAQAPSVDLGTCVFWGQPLFEEAKGGGKGIQKVAEARLERTARITVYFFPEVLAS